MANNAEESSPLLGEEQEKENHQSTRFASTSSVTSGPMAAESAKQPPPPLPPQQQRQERREEVAAAATVAMGWTAEGLPMPVAPVAAMAEPVTRRDPWDTGLCDFFGRNDEFCSSNLEVCVLGSVAPCVLYGSNAERLEPAPGNFANPCLYYSALYMIGNSLFGWNCMAPWLSYPTRTAIRQKFNLEGSCEALTRSCGCCGRIWEDEERREQCESACDLATHVFCHPCALCQEGRELRCRLPHPGFTAQPVLVVVPPPEQAMGRDSLSLSIA